MNEKLTLQFPANLQAKRLIKSEAAKLDMSPSQFVWDCVSWKVKALREMEQIKESAEANRL